MEETTLASAFLQAMMQREVRLENCTLKRKGSGFTLVSGTQELSVEPNSGQYAVCSPNEFELFEPQVYVSEVLKKMK